MLTKGSFRIFLSLVVTLAALLFLSSGVVEARDWKPGDVGGCAQELGTSLPRDARGPIFANPGAAWAVLQRLAWRVLAKSVLVVNAIPGV